MLVIWHGGRAGCAKRWHSASISMGSAYRDVDVCDYGTGCTHWGATEVSPRIGITKNSGALWRYSFTGNRFVSR